MTPNNSDIDEILDDFEAGRRFDGDTTRDYRAEAKAKLQRLMIDVRVEEAKHWVAILVDYANKDISYNKTKQLANERIDFIGEQLQEMKNA